MRKKTLTEILSVMNIRKVFYSDTFLYARALIPTRQLKEALKVEGVDYGRKITLTNVFKGIMWMVTHRQDLTLRELTNIGTSPTVRTATGMPESLSHVSIVKLLQKTDFLSVYEVMQQLLKGYLAGARTRKKRYEKVFITDTTVLTNGHKVKGKRTKEEARIFPFTKLCVLLSPETYLVQDWMFSHSHADNEAFETIVKWDKSGYTYVLDRGDIDMGFYKAFTDSGNFFVTERYSNHKIQWIYNVPLPKKPTVKQFTLLRVGEAIIGANPNTRQRVKMVQVEKRKQNEPGKPPEKVWIVTNRLSLTPKRIVELWSLRWQIETSFNWLKRTCKLRGTQWNTVQGLEVFTSLLLTVMTILLAWCARHYGLTWWKAGTFSFREALRFLCLLLDRFWEYRAFQSRGKSLRCRSLTPLEEVKKESYQ